MNEPIADVKSWSEACRLSLAPWLRIQQDGLGALDRFARCQYAVAGDFLEWSLAQSRVTLVAHSPAVFLAKQAELGIKFSAQLRSRVQELTKIRSEGQTTSSLAFAVATAVAPVIRVPATAVNTRVPVVHTVAIKPVTTRSHTPSTESGAEHSASPTGVQRPAPGSTAPRAQLTAPTVEARMPDLKISPASVKSSSQFANADVGRPSEGSLHSRDAAPGNSQSASKGRSPALSRTTRDSGKPKNRNKT
jgi:hypothetical protein